MGQPPGRKRVPLAWVFIASVCKAAVSPDTFAFLLDIHSEIPRHQYVTLILSTVHACSSVRLPVTVSMAF